MGPSLDSDTLRIHLLGGFRVWVGPRAISDSAWRLSKAKAVVKLATWSRRRASNAGRTNGSIRLSTWTRKVKVSDSQLRNAEPVLARGADRLVFESGCVPVGIRTSSGTR